MANKVSLITTKLLMNVVTFVYLLFKANPKRGDEKKCIETEIRHVFISVKKRHLMIGCLAMLSFSRYVDNIQFNILFDYTPGLFDKLILKRSSLNIVVIQKKVIEQIKRKIKRYKWCSMFFDTGWQGKKFFVPILYNKIKKAIVLDCDTLFFKYPSQLVNWGRSDSDCIYMEDCDNYTVISPIEARSIIKKQINIRNLNCGLLGINTNVFWCFNSLKKINGYIKHILEIESSRRITVSHSEIPYGLREPLLEQTLYWLTFDQAVATVLPPKYYLIGKHILNKQEIGDPIFIHFAGDVDKKALYYYLRSSLVEWLIDKTRGKLSNTNPWYTYSSRYCYLCKR